MVVSKVTTVEYKRLSTPLFRPRNVLSGAAELGIQEYSDAGRDDSAEGNLFASHKDMTAHIHGKLLGLVYPTRKRNSSHADWRH
jgi:hypothetical protein